MLITGCINPIENQKYLVLKNAEERLRQYVSSIEFWITCSPFTRIVFCDNSRFEYHGIEELQRLASDNNKEFEWISFQGNNQKVLECGKGYGEGEIIEYALCHSRLLRRAIVFAKITGRLKIKNAYDLTKNTKEGVNYFNRDIYRGHGIDTRFYLCDICFYTKYLMHAYYSTSITPNQVIAIEDIFYTILHKKRMCYRALMSYPVFEGKSGGNGRDYSKVPSAVTMALGAACRMNVFNQCYPIVLALQKMMLVITGRI